MSCTYIAIISKMSRDLLSGHEIVSSPTVYTRLGTRYLEMTRARRSTADPPVDPGRGAQRCGIYVHYLLCTLCILSSITSNPRDRIICKMKNTTRTVWRLAGGKKSSRAVTRLSLPGTLLHSALFVFHQDF